jgi:hypothetical protein
MTSKPIEARSLERIIKSCGDVHLVFVVKRSSAGKYNMVGQRVTPDRCGTYQVDPSPSSAASGTEVKLAERGGAGIRRH